MSIFFLTQKNVCLNYNFLKTKISIISISIIVITISNIITLCTFTTTGPEDQLVVAEIKRRSGAKKNKTSLRRSLF